jgi:hypothetical protein
MFAVIIEAVPETGAVARERTVVVGFPGVWRGRVKRGRTVSTVMDPSQRGSRLGAFSSTISG